MNVKEQESQTNSADKSRKKGNGEITHDDTQNRKSDCCNSRCTCCQPVQAIGQVNRIGRANDDKEGQDIVEPA